MKKSKLLEAIKDNSFFFAGLAFAVGIALVPNYLINTRKIVTSTSVGESKVQGLVGHTEYLQHTNGSQEFKIYGGFGHRIQESTFGLDFEGDGKVDILRINGSEFSANKLKSSLVRSLDYSANKEKFDNADKQLEELRSHYFSK